MTSMTISKQSPLTGKRNTRTINCTPQQYRAWQQGQLIQEAMPQVSADDREFLITGYTPEDWNKLFAPTNDDQPLTASLGRIRQYRLDPSG